MVPERGQRLGEQGGCSDGVRWTDVGLCCVLLLVLLRVLLVLFSGVPPDALTTLQGNPYTEACGDCGRQYLRDYLVRAKTSIPRKHKRYRGSHETGRFCTHPECNGAVGGGTFGKRGGGRSFALADCFLLFCCRFPFSLSQDGCTTTWCCRKKRSIPTPCVVL